MKKLTLLFTIFFTAIYSNAQNVAINNDGTSAASSAMLDVKSSTKGFMMPRVTSAQRTAIASPALGLLVFDTDTKTIWAYNGTAWTNLSSAGGGGFTLPYENSAAIAGSAFKITNSGTAIEGVTTGASSNGIKGTATANGSNGVMGISSAANGVGVRGESNTGSGVVAYSTTGTGLNAFSNDGSAVYGSSINGVGVYASSSNGLALNVIGKLKISGGNTNPSNGAVLTSDASGNAVWKTNRVAFRGFDINTSYVTIPANAAQQIYYAAENYDLSNGFIPFQSGPKPANASSFAIPIDGIYHFDASANLFFDEDDFDAHTTIWLKLDRGGSISTIGYASGIKSPVQYPAFQTGTHYHLRFSGDFILFPGDKVYIEVSQFNDDNETAVISQSPIYAFTGHLVVAY